MWLKKKYWSYSTAFSHFFSLFVRRYNRCGGSAAAPPPSGGGAVDDDDALRGGSDHFETQHRLGKMVAFFPPPCVCVSERGPFHSYIRNVFVFIFLR